jgi:hypothetical protein
MCSGGWRIRTARSQGTCGNSVRRDGPGAFPRDIAAFCWGPIDLCPLHSFGAALNSIVISCKDEQQPRLDAVRSGKDVEGLFPRKKRVFNYNLTGDPQ